MNSLNPRLLGGRVGIELDYFLCEGLDCSKIEIFDCLQMLTTQNENLQSLTQKLVDRNSEFHLQFLGRIHVFSMRKSATLLL